MPFFRYLNFHFSTVSSINRLHANAGGSLTGLLVFNDTRRPNWFYSRRQKGGAGLHFGFGGHHCLLRMLQCRKPSLILGVEVRFNTSIIPNLFFQISKYNQYLALFFIFFDIGLPYASFFPISFYVCLSVSAWVFTWTTRSFHVLCGQVRYVPD